MSSSYGGDITWYINNELFTAGVSGKACFLAPSDYQVKVRNVTTETVYIDNVPTIVTAWDNQYATILTGNNIKGTIADLPLYLESDTTTNVTVDEYRVTIAHEVETDVEPTTEGETSCYSRGEDVTVVPTITLNRPGADPSLHTIKYTVTDPEGIEVDLFQDEFPLDVLAPNITFTLDKLGVYTVLMEVTDAACNTVFDSEFIVETCNFVFIKYLECNAFEIQNRSSDTMFTYSIGDIASADTVLASGSLGAGFAETLSFSDVSMYIMTVTYERGGETITEEYILNNYCIIEKCFTSYIEDLLCAPEQRCAPCPPESDLKQMLFFYNTYFMKIHKLFNVNSFFSALDQEGLDELTNLKQLMDKMVAFCMRRNCTDSVNSAFQSSHMSEGPYDWAGQGSNKTQSCNCGTKSVGTSYTATSPGYCSTCNS